MAKKYAQAWSYESITVSGTEIGCTEEKVIDGLDQILVTAEAANMRFRTDGGVPTDTEGHLFEVGDVLSVTGLEEIKNLLFIKATGTDATVRVTYYV